MSYTLRGTCAGDLRRVSVRRSVTMFGNRRVVNLRLADIETYPQETSHAPSASSPDVSNMTTEEVEAAIAKAVYQE